ncbi:hypothetical protein VTN31DRAFT_2621 [Thermomyces dupontii]|uniref:uncharacterized protein n=1 Tax=Talaromyces thermophilus TaxID=28565 RepID=UPI003744AE73
MLPTPSTSHVSFDTIYEPAEDSYLFLDTLSSESESEWLRARFSNAPTPLVLEVGSGSGVVLAFAAVNARHIFGRDDVLTLGTDVNGDACQATRETVTRAVAETTSADDKPRSGAQHTASLTADLFSPLRPGSVDVLLFNPPYVPTPDVPSLPSPLDKPQSQLSRTEKFARDSYFLSLTYAGGVDGMEITNRFLEAMPAVLHPERGTAYVLFCAQNQPARILERIQNGWPGWKAEVVGRSGSKAGWEKLVILRIWRDSSASN